MDAPQPRTSSLLSRWLLNCAIAFAVIVGLMLFGATGRPDASAAGGKSPRVALFIAGTLGDKSFNDSAARGIAASKARWNLRTRVIEGGYDPSRWESSLTDLADGGDFDVVIAGTYAVVSIIEKLAPRYPDVRFIVYDAAVDPARCGCSNVYSILFRQNEGAYLAGWLATRLLGPAPRVGVIGAMQIPVIDDFITGFTAGAQAADPHVTVSRQYVNSFKDPAGAKEIAKALYAQGAGVIFQAAGASGQGVVEAAEEAQRYVIGVDSDQYTVYKASHPNQARFIATSVMKDVDVALERALGAHLAHRLRYGSVESIGLAEGGISLAPDSDVLRTAPAALRTELDAVRQRIVAGGIAVPSVFAAAATRTGAAP
jgi:basic membrane protein A and related proteins